MTKSFQTASASIPSASHAQIQALVFRGWKSYRWTAYVFVRLSEQQDEARAWLSAVAEEIAWAAGASPQSLHIGGRPVEARLQLALAWPGLRRLGVPTRVLERFPQEFRDGMRKRARLLGDKVDRAKEPTEWTFPRGGDAMVMIYAREEHERDALIEEHRARAKEHGGEVVVAEPSAEWRDREPFGFADGLSQPVIRGQPSVRELARSERDEIDAGDFVLGYSNEYGQVPVSPIYEEGDGIGGRFDLGANGTYLAFRKLEQHPVTFWRKFLELGEHWKGVGPVPVDALAAAEWLAARAMGRWTNGNPVALCPDRPGDQLPRDVINNFLFGLDPEGVRCPIGAHIRRANPRDQRGGTAQESWTVVNRHRIIRRGRAFGSPERHTDWLKLAVSEPAPREATGLLFVSLQASIAHGFEFVQQIWNNNSRFHGMFDEPDPIVGPGGGCLTIPSAPLRVRLGESSRLPTDPPMASQEGLPRFVTPRGGEYFFVPSRSAVEVLRTGQAPRG